MYRNAISWTTASGTWAVEMALAKNDAFRSRGAQRWLHERSSISDRYGPASFGMDGGRIVLAMRFCPRRIDPCVAPCNEPTDARRERDVHEIARPPRLGRRIASDRFVQSAGIEAGRQIGQFVNDDIGTVFSQRGRKGRRIVGIEDHRSKRYRFF